MFKPLASNTSTVAQKATRTRESQPHSAVVSFQANRSTAKRPAIVDRVADFEIPHRLWRERDVRGRPTAIARALTEEERVALELRQAELEVSCSPFTAAEQDRAIGAISFMLSGFRSLRQDDEESAVAGLEGLRHVLAPFPLWAIEAGCLAISRGEAMLDGQPLNRRFPPNDSEVYAVVKEIVRPYLALRDDAVALLLARVRDA